MTTVTLTRPIRRGETQIGAVTLREPDAGAMRGLKLLDILQIDVAALIRLVPRIADPYLSEAEVAGLGPTDITRIGMAVIGFFAAAAEAGIGPGPDTPTT